MDNNDNATTRLILHGIKLAKELEANLLPNLANQPPDTISASCEEIIRVFTSVRERLQPHSLTMIHEPPPPQRPAGSSGGDGGGNSIQDWLMGRSSAGQALDLFHAQVLGGEQAPAVEGSAAVSGSEVAESSRGPGGPSSSQRRRREETDRITVNVLAPQMGNLDMPPDDCYAWRKYGQKDILGSKFPRAYYRCTHQKLYNCPAKKQVQRLDDNPQMLKVTYRYHHTCHMSATAPSAPPPPPPPPAAAVGDVLQPPGTATHQQPQPPAGGGASSSYWLSMDIKPITSEGMQMHTDFASTSGVAPGGGGAEPSTAARYVDFGSQPVVDMADAMFNSGSSSNNSMDFIFHTVDEN